MDLTKEQIAVLSTVSGLIPTDTMRDIFKQLSDKIDSGYYNSSSFDQELVSQRKLTHEMGFSEFFDTFHCTIRELTRDVAK